jgi:hypothetical protein
MTPQDTNELPSISSWQTLLLRLTAFPTPDFPLSNQDWWSTIVGDLPDKRTEQPRIAAKIDEGSYENGRLSLTVLPTRIDWQLVSKVALENPIKTIEDISLGRVPEAIKVFQDLMNRWLKLIDTSLVRLAFGIVLVQPAENKEDAYKLLSKYIPYEIPLEEASDFLFQINRPRNTKSGISNLKINRLSKWSVLMFQQEITDLTNPKSRYNSPELFSVRLELDINSSGDYEDELATESFAKLFQEFIELGQEIASNGDLA